ncbi:hypothetical protein ABMY35_16565 [Pseudoalteromonas sp. BZB3]|uniref:hypothetical protein n=1 Tax=Pseudoalteromonas sp. BZB3 TaxID=3136670 RepID=UPI0032C48C4E
MKMIKLIFSIILSCSVTVACAEPKSTLEKLTKDLSNWFQSANKANLDSWQYTFKNNRHHLQATSTVNGGGALIYRLNAKACIISIPHRFFDTHTYTIGEQIYNKHCQLMLANTHHRHSDSLDKQSMDYSKRRDNLHNSAILAFQSIHPNAKILQLHGFNQSKRKSDNGRQADFIISQGRKGNVIKQQLTLCLSKISKNSYFYPELIQELGGTKNILHKLNLAPFSFIHIEISKPMRKRLVKEQHTMSQFSECINQVI